MSNCNHKWQSNGRCAHCRAIEPGAEEYKTKRLKRGLTQQQICEILALSRATVNRIERGKAPMSHQLRKMLDLFYENLVLREMAAEAHPELSFR